jgi:hypothetical protein
VGRTVDHTVAQVGRTVEHHTVEHHGLERRTVRCGLERRTVEHRTVVRRTSGKSEKYLLCLSLA